MHHVKSARPMSGPVLPWLGRAFSTQLTATRESLLERKPDAVICATGAHYDTTGFSPYRPDRDFIPGYQQSL
jgi:hypothetical protein